jgi:hypothetical protein
MVAVALGSGDVALYRLPLWGSGGGEDDANKPCPSRVRPAQTLRHRGEGSGVGGAGGAPLSAWRVEFNATGTALACSVEPAAVAGGRGGGDDGEAPPQVWFWMPNLESGVWRAVASVEGGEDVGGEGDDQDDGGVRMLEA